MMSTMEDMELTYPEVGATAAALPPGYHHLSRSRVVGRGETAFKTAADALMKWDVQRRAGLGVQPAGPVRLGADVTLTLRFGPVRITAPCRVVAVLDEPRLRGFAYGTLPGHPETGEERFVLAWLPDDRVLFMITAFSRPGRWYTRLAGPLARLAQGRATEAYLAALEALEAR
jgi:uncharacterized protein (UPF0548 family)